MKLWLSGIKRQMNANKCIYLFYVYLHLYTPIAVWYIYIYIYIYIHAWHVYLYLFTHICNPKWQVIKHPDIIPDIQIYIPVAYRQVQCLDKWWMTLRTSVEAGDRQSGENPHWCAPHETEKYANVTIGYIPSLLILVWISEWFHFCDFFYYTSSSIPNCLRQFPFTIGWCTRVGSDATPMTIGFMGPRLSIKSTGTRQLFSLG